MPSPGAAEKEKTEGGGDDGGGEGRDALAKQFGSQGGNTLFPESAVWVPSTPSGSTLSLPRPVRSLPFESRAGGQKFQVYHGWMWVLTSATSHLPARSRNGHGYTAAAEEDGFTSRISFYAFPPRRQGEE